MSAPYNRFFDEQPDSRLYDAIRPMRTPTGRVPRLYLEGLGRNGSLGSVQRKAAPQIYDPYPILRDAQGRQMPRYGLQGVSADELGQAILRLKARAAARRKAVEAALRSKETVDMVAQTIVQSVVRRGKAAGVIRSGSGMGNLGLTFAEWCEQKGLPEDFIHYNDYLAQMSAEGRYTEPMEQASVIDGLWLLARDAADKVQDVIVGGGTTTQQDRQNAEQYAFDLALRHEKGEITDEQYNELRGQLADIEADINAPLLTFVKEVPKQIAAGAGDFLKRLEEIFAWLSRNWKLIAIGGGVIVAAPILASVVTAGRSVKRAVAG